ncbi:endonuclease [Arthrobacter sp. PM3]|nr:endonuclease [Arthrobacter sp. PM3]
MKDSIAAVAVFAARAAGHAPGSVSGRASLAGSDPLRDQADAYLDGLAEVARMEARLAGLKVHFAAGYADAAETLAAPARSPQEHTMHEMSLIAEVAGVLTVSERSAAALLSDARTLATALPLTLGALQEGMLSWQHARVMCDETSALEPPAAAALEAHFLDPDAPRAARGCPAGELVPARFRAKARSWRERHHPVSIEARHRRSAADRRLEYAPDRDGMAWLSSYMPADTASGIWARATEAARALQGPDEPRTLTQLRADVAADWLLRGVAEGTPSPTAQVLVTVPVLSLLGTGSEPSMLDGYGPIPASMARRIVGEGATSFLRVLTDPRSGAPLEIGRTSYRIPKAMRQWLRLRDGRCPFPGCSNPSLDNEADHLLAWDDGGSTGITNLGQPCPKHHRLKHATPWNPVDATRDKPPGWTSPSGRCYPSEEQDWEPPDLAPLGGEPPEWAPQEWVLPVREPLDWELEDLLEDVDSLDRPLPVDPFPEWASFAAA